MNKQKRINWLKDRISSMEQCRDEMPFGLSDDESMELSAYKDSLASLTSEPVAYMTYKGYLLHAGDPKVSEYSDPEPLYDAPPVPEIKLPSDSDFDSWFKSIEAGDDGNWQEPAYQSVEWYQYLSRRQLAKGAFNFYADEIKRLNGLGE